MRCSRTPGECFDDGDYRWVAELVNHLVFADPTNVEARELQADALEQLGYQSESATFRNAFLCGAHELRYGHPPRNDAMKRGLLDGDDGWQLLDAVAVRLRAEDGRRVGGDRASAGWWHVAAVRWRLDGGVVEPGDLVSRRACMVRRTRWHRWIDRCCSISSTNSTDDRRSAIGTGRIEVEGDAAALVAVFGHLDTFQSMFPIVEP